MKQQVKIKTFEEKKQRNENKKFHKALKDFKMKAKHAEKRDNMEQINQLKKKIRERGDDMADEDFEKFNSGKPQTGRKGGRGGPGTLDTVREKERQRQKKKNDFKQSGKAGSKNKKKAGGAGKSKRPGKNARGRKGSKGKRR